MSAAHPLRRESSRPGVIAQQSEHKNKYAIVVGVGIGTLFGFFLEKGKVALPSIIRSQMQMKSFVMMEMFLAASATGIASTYFLKWLGVSEKRNTTAIALGFSLMGGYGANVVGGLLMGTGMTLSGNCPGTAAAALGSGMWTSAFVILGGLLGAGAFAHFEAFAKQRKPAFHSKSTSHLVDEALGRSHFEVAAGFSVAIAVGLYVLDGYFPFREGLKIAFAPGAAFSTDLSLRADAWPPALAGAMIGLLQIPSFLLLDRYLGASSCYVTGACVIERAVDKDVLQKVPYYRSFFSFHDFGQIGTLLGIAVGAYVSAHLSGSNTILHVPPFSISVALQSIVGGAVLLFGARLAGGCASGHGLSGMAKLSFAALVTVGGMFAGGMLSAAVLLPLLPSQ